MRVLLRLFPVVVWLAWIAGCSESTGPSVVPAASPSPTAQIETPSPTSEPEQVLVAGQWNRLFYHPQLEKVILLNGGPDRGKPIDDPLELWAWDGAAWTLLSADPNGPRWRNFAGAAFDTKRNVLIVHGGLQDQDQRMEDTWEWDGQIWTQFTEPGPGFREGAAMAYDERRGKTILLCGSGTGQHGHISLKAGRLPAAAWAVLMTPGAANWLPLAAWQNQGAGQSQIHGSGTARHGFVFGGVSSRGRCNLFS